MTKSKFKILISLFLILILLSSFSFATEVKTSEDQVSPISEDTATPISEDTSGEGAQDTSNWTNGDLYISDYSVNVDSIVDGNAFILGNDVTITGEIGGDLFVLANKVTIDSGYVYSNVFVCANELTVNGVIYDLYATCTNFNLGPNGFVYRDMRVNSATSNIEGKVRRNAFISSGSINIKEDAGTLINGNLKYSSNSEINIPDGVVSGEVTYHNVNSSKNIGATILSYVSDLIVNLFYTFVVVMLLIWIAPKFLEKVSNMSTKKSLVSLGVGILAPIILSIVGILLMASVIGTPIGVILIFITILIASIGSSISSIYFGKLFTKHLKMEGKVKFVLFTLVSSLILWALSLIPFIGGFISFLVTIFGMGILLINIFPSKKQIEVEVKE